MSEVSVGAVAREREDVAVGDEIVRHRLASRLVHWSVAITFTVALLSGMPIYSPVFGWMAHIFGGLSVCRWLHAWVGLAFVASIAVMFFFWIGDMHFDAADKKFDVVKYMKFGSEEENQDVGKYNAGQKLFFFMFALGALAFLLSGTVLWWPTSFGQTLRSAAILIHDLSFIAFFVAYVGHIYLGTAAEPGTFQSMTRGTVTRKWARFHHPRWFRDVTGEKS